MSNKVFLTGAGIVAPSGTDPETHWKSMASGTNHIGKVPAERFVVDEYAATLAAVVPHDFRGAVEFGQRELQNLWAKGKEHVSAYQSYAWFYAVNTGQISIRHKFKGPSCVVVADHAGGLDVFGKAKSLLAAGTSAVVVGGVDGPICPWAWAPNIASGRLSSSVRPDSAYLPFSPDATGAVLGEGGALLVAETEESLERRGGPAPLAELAGTATGFGPTEQSRTDGSALAATIRRALDDAGLAPADIGVVLADAAGQRDEDASEAAALADVFGAQQVPVTAPKAGYGRLLAGAGAVDVLTACQIIVNKTIPPTPGVTEHLHNIDLVTDAPRQLDKLAVLVVARGIGGFCSAAVITGT
ncbi:beta-ketoacyl synthase N-terminal-like domain-containing protein [Antrihabitans cavernicola]|uniref:beta-ketoacyl synthase N-terminal-like domain-containing protein n=1 Tax=Antrihabitans cavernicola TaxID=2495913 RepID=UPI001BE4AD01|nr:beta-ketoacyl synthase N-terminal-like domain-containing protein [Spelaeibacter cavernicola]